MNDTEIKQNKVILEDEYNGEKKVHVLNHIGEIVPIEEIDAKDFNNELFRQNYLKNNKPLVIRNALNVFDCGSAFKNWSLDYLSKKCGLNKVFYFFI